MPLLPASKHPPTSFPVATLTPHCPAIMSSRDGQNFSTQVEAAINLLLNMHLRSYLPISGLLFRLRQCGSRGHEPHVPQVGQEEAAPSSRSGPAMSEWGKASETTEANMVLEKNLNQVIWDLHVLGSAHTCPFSVPSGRATS